MDAVGVARSVLVGLSSRRRPPKTRSSITNDPFVRMKGTTRSWERRRRDVVEMILEVLDAEPTDLQFVNVRKASELIVAAEILRARMLQGDRSLLAISFGSKVKTAAPCVLFSSSLRT